MTTAEPGSAQAFVLEIAQGEVGFFETDNNITKYWAELDPGLQGQPWCAAFVSWCFIQAENPLPAIDRSYGFIDCSNGLNHYDGEGRLFSEPEPGDIVLYHFGKPFPVHTGIVQSVGEDGFFVAIEGNTSRDDAGSQDNGGEVCRKTRHISDVSGFGRPAYEEGVNQLKPDEREALLTVKAFVADLQAAMSEEKEGRLQQPKIDRIEQEIAALSARVAAIAAKVGATA